MQESSIQKLSTEELVQYLDQRDFGYLQMQSSFWDTVFSQLLSGLYNEMIGTIHQTNYLRSLSEIHQIINHLSPGSKFFEQIITFDTLYQIQNELFPPHIQLFLQENQIQQQNPVFCNFSQNFQENIQKNKIKLTPYMIFWIFTLKTLYRDPVKHPIIINQLPFKEPIFVSFTHNPNLIIIRKHLTYIQEQVSSQQHQRNFWLQLFTKMITLLREFTLYQCLFQLIPNELKLSQLQMHQLHRMREQPYITNSHLEAIYLLIIFNNQSIEQNYQQYQQIYRKSSTTPSYPFSNKLIFEQALYRLLYFGLGQFCQDKQCYEMQLSSYSQVWLLYLRQPYARFENNLMVAAKAYDQILCYYNERMLEDKREKHAIDTTFRRSVIKSILQELKRMQYFFFSKIEFLNLYYKKKLLRSMKVKIDLSKDYFYNEPDFLQKLRTQFPYYSALLNKFLITVSQIPNLSYDDQYALEEMIKFLTIKQDPKSSLLMGSVKLTGGVQNPGYQELKSHCDAIQGEYCISDQFQIFGNKTVMENIKRIFWQIRSDEVRNSLNFIYQLNENGGSLVRNYSPQKRVSSRMSVPKPVYRNNWEIPPKDNEIYYLLVLLRIMSYVIDVVTFRKSLDKEHPITQWPRWFASTDSIRIIMVLVVLWYIGSIVYRYI